MNTKPNGKSRFRDLDALHSLPIPAMQRAAERFPRRASGISRRLWRSARGFHVILALALIGSSCLAAEPSLSFQSSGEAVPLTPVDSQRLIQEIEAVVKSANFNTLNHPGGFLASDFRPVEEIKKDSFLHVHYGAPTKFATVGGDLIATDIWIDIRHVEPNNPHGGLLPGPTTLVNAEGTTSLGKESGVLLIALGLDPAIFGRLPPLMQKSLEGRSEMLEAYRRRRQ